MRLTQMQAEGATEMDKAEQYRELLSEIEAVIAGETYLPAR